MKKPKKQNQTPPPKHSEPKRHKLPQWFIFGGPILLALVGLTAFLFWDYHDRVLPNVYIGNVPVGNMAQAQLKQAVQNEVAQVKLTFKDGATSLTATAADVGVSVNIDATIKQAMLARRGPQWSQNLALWQAQTVPLVYNNDAGVLKDFIVQHFPQIYVDPQDAQLTFNATTDQYDIIPGVNGKGFDIKKFEAALPNLARNPRPMTLAVSSVPVEPLIGERALKSVQGQANQLLKLPLQFLHNGKVAYAAQPADIASWIYFEPNTTAGTMSLQFDSAKVQQFLSAQVGGKVTNLPVDRKVVIDKQSGAQHVLQEGRVGNQLQDIDKLTANVMDALSTNKPLSADLVVEQAPFKTVTVSGYGKWIEVDLSRQTTTLYVGNEPVDSFLISSGKARTPTEIGTFAVYRKLPLTTMTGTILGEYYYVPNIKWVSYFDDGEAFHGTYWHHNFGHPMSHGCINMTEADAKILYDFAPVGTKVVVHS
jgi:lipoprotein-anchoring transpeptidase ErfK/SrfK